LNPNETHQPQKKKNKKTKKLIPIFNGNMLTLFPNLILAKMLFILILMAMAFKQ
jgi:hypothetical protein